MQELTIINTTTEVVLHFHQAILTVQAAAQQAAAQVIAAAFHAIQHRIVLGATTHQLILVAAATQNAVEVFLIPSLSALTSYGGELMKKVWNWEQKSS
jgi:hypothetical protein